MGRPDINIVCEKVAFHGLTRFEDRHALPLGVSSNFTAYSAKLLTQVRLFITQSPPEALHSDVVRRVCYHQCLLCGAGSLGIRVRRCRLWRELHPVKELLSRLVSH